MQFARSIFERITAQAILPMVTLGVSGAIAATMMDLLQTWRNQRAPQPLRISK
jgi:hypothetical protein